MRKLIIAAFTAFVCNVGMAKNNDTDQKDYFFIYADKANLQCNKIRIKVPFWINTTTIKDQYHEKLVLQPVETYQNNYDHFSFFLSCYNSDAATINDFLTFSIKEGKLVLDTVKWQQANQEFSAEFDQGLSNALEEITDVNTTRLINKNLQGWLSSYTHSGWQTWRKNLEFCLFDDTTKTAWCGGFSKDLTHENTTDPESTIRQIIHSIELVD